MEFIRTMIVRGPLRREGIHTFTNVKKSPQAFLGIQKIFPITVGLSGQSGRISPKRRGRTYPVRKVKLVNMEQMLLNTSQGLNNAADLNGAMRKDDACQILQSTNCGKGVPVVAQAVSLLNELRTALRIKPTPQKQVHIAHHSTGAPGISHPAVSKPDANHKGISRTLDNFPSARSMFRSLFYRKSGSGIFRHGLPGCPGKGWERKAMTHSRKGRHVKARSP